MWIVILNFCLFLLLIGFFFYGLRQWSGLIADYEDGSSDEEAGTNIVEGRFHRLPLWILLIGAGVCSLLGDILNWLGY